MTKLKGVSDLLDNIIGGKEGWEKLPTLKCGGPIDLGFFIESKEEGRSVIYRIEDTTTISFEIAANGLLEQILNLDFHEATEEEIKEYKER